MTAFLIREMRDADVPSAMRLKDAEGWNQMEADWLFFLSHNPGLCLVACMEDQVIGTVTAVDYNHQVAWIGMMLVARESRGQGVGKQLLNAVIERLGDCQSIKLDATPAGMPVYRKLGFVEELELHRMIVSEMSLSEEKNFSVDLRRIQEADIPELIDYDQRVFGARRAELIRYLVRDPTNRGWLIQKNGEVTGFVLSRRGSRFCHVGPVYASSENDARALIAKFVKASAQRPLVIDIHASHHEWRDWLLESGFVQQRLLVRMFLKGNDYPGKIKAQYAISGPELG